MIPIPRSRPQASRELVASKARERWMLDRPGEAMPTRYVLAVRGYYATTILGPGNDVNAYDDAFFIVTPDGGMTAWNGNTDPTRYGWNPNAGKYMARLRPGCWRFIRRMHRGKYQAFGQGDNVVSVDRVKADASVSRIDTGGDFGIDLHIGGVFGTSSEGCLTVPPYQWEDFRRAVNGSLAESGTTEFDLILVDGPIN